jgi:hypothetical protein
MNASQVLKPLFGVEATGAVMRRQRKTATPATRRAYLGVSVNETRVKAVASTAAVQLLSSSRGDEGLHGPSRMPEV